MVKREGTQAEPNRGPKRSRSGPKATVDVVREYFDALGRHDLKKAEALRAKASTAQPVDAERFLTKSGRDQLSRLDSIAEAAFPDLQIDVTEMHATGEKVVTEWVAGGTFKGGPTSLPLSEHFAPAIRGVSVSAVKAGKIVHHSVYWDLKTLLMNLDLQHRPKAG